MKSVYVALFAAMLIACGARVTIGELVPDQRSEDDSTLPTPLPVHDDASLPPEPDASIPIDAGPAPDAGADAGDFDAGKAPYVPCAGKACGDDCSLCDSTDPSCVETAVLKACDPTGQCVASPPSCQ